jgi:hypothetical protein
MSIETLHIGKYHASPIDPDPHDPRGILWIFEPPRRGAHYVIGVDPTSALNTPGWNRSLRTKEDAKIDNSAIEVFRVGIGTPDIQVAEWAAPLDAESLAVVVNFLGRLYGETEDDGQALVCIEMYPGPGWMTHRELVNRFGYYNFPPWVMETGGLGMKMTAKTGWYSNVSTRRDLWTRGANHINKQRVVIQSPWFIEEMVDCTPDNFLAVTARALGGRHDDRVVAGLIGIWFANQWSFDLEPTEPTVLENPSLPDYQRTAISAGRMMQEWQDKFSSLLGE